MKRMLFNATHQEELRVAIVDGQKLIDLDIETAGREQRKGNIYKGVITRIEPGLEACFVNYGEERHGFLPFKEVARSYFKEGVDVRSARIQDALTEGQELIIQVEKEERGNKGAALTTFISLAGRYLVLMPNNPRGGGVSRRVEGEDRQELRETMDQLDLPQGMSIIARTAGIGRSVEELQWDLSYLLQLWSAIDIAANENKAPILIYLESSLVIRAIRDYYSPEIGEILIDTDDIFEQATAFMSVVMPDNVQRVKMYRDDIPLFSRFQIEHQIETAYSRTVQLPSGGSVVIDHTEALVAIDVNSARSTRGADIEETAMRTNLEAADEVARQLRLRDLGGLIVIDFIDMEDNKNQRAVEQRLRDALHFDRARVQMGKISRFGLMELSRQRLRPALNEGSHITCPRCNGTGVIRDAESSALQVLRLLQEEAMKEGTAALHAQVPVDVATFLLNEKRHDIAKIESRLKVNLILIPNKNLETPHHHIERLRHDDPRLEDNKTSIELVTQPEAPTTWAPSRAQEASTRPEALVKSIAHSQPAPRHVESAPAAPVAASKASGGLFKRLFGWLAGSSAAPATEQQPAAADTKPASANRQRAARGNERRERSMGGERSRQRRNERRPDAEVKAAEHVAAKPRRQAVPEAARPQEELQRPAAVAAPQAGEAASATATNGRGRNRRGRGRNRREDGVSNAADTDTMIATTAAGAAAGTVVAAEAMETAIPTPPVSQEEVRSQALTEQPEDDTFATTEARDGEDGEQVDPERKRRRRRSRRGRRSGDATDAAVAGDTPAEGSDEAVAQADAIQAESAEDGKATQASSTEAAPAVETGRGAEPVAVAFPAEAQATTETPRAAPAAAQTDEVVASEASTAEKQAAISKPAWQPAVASAAESVATASANADAREADTPASTEASYTAAAPASTGASDDAGGVAAARTSVVQQAAEPAEVEEVAGSVDESAVAVEPAALARIAEAEAAEPAPAPAINGNAAPVVAESEVEEAETTAADDHPGHTAVTGAGFDKVLSDAGMQLIETRFAPAPAAPEPAVRLGRARKPVAAVADQPLQQVETH